MQKVRKIIGGYEFEFRFWEDNLGVPCLQVLLIQKEERREYPWANEKIVVEKKSTFSIAGRITVLRGRKKSSKRISALKEQEQDRKTVERFCSEGANESI